MMFIFLGKMNRKMMVAAAFFLFSPFTPEINGVRRTIVVIVDRHSEQMLMRNVLTVRFLFPELSMQIPHSLLFI